MTILYNDPTKGNEQDLQTDYESQITKSPSDLAWTVHLPLCINDRSYLFIWSVQGCRIAVYLKDGRCLLLLSNV